MTKAPLPGLFGERGPFTSGEAMIIAVPEAIHEDAVHLLRTHADVVDWMDPQPDLTRCDGIIVRTRTLDRATLARSSLKVVGSHGVGVDNIDLKACADLGITVVNVPEGTANAVAELTFALMLAVARKIEPGMADIRAGRAVRTAPARRGVELAGKVLGIVGYGHIGRRVAEIGRLGFGMDVHAYSRSLASRTVPAHVTVHTSLADLVAEADYLCLCVPLTVETRGLIGAEELALMKPTAILVNCARGGVVDEAALCQALRNGRLFGAACDVFEEEPPRAGNPLLSCENFVASQHIGINTDECLRRIGLSVAHDVLAVLDGREPRNRVSITW